MLKILQIQAENFAQYKEFTHTFHDGVWAVTGANRVGKSTIYEALYWCLYGQTARGMKTVRRRGTKDSELCKVGVECERDGKKFYVERSQGKSSAKSSVLLPSKKDFRDSGNLAINQKMIDELLGMNAQFFLGATLFGNKSFRFTQAKDSERKQLFETALSLDRFIATATFARAQSAIVRRKVDELNGSIETAQQSLTDVANQLNTKKKDILKELEESLQDKQDEYRAIVEESKKLKKLVGDVDAYERENNDAMARLSRVLSQKGANERTLRKFDDLAICPECQQVVTASHKKHIRDKLLKEGRQLREEEKNAREQVRKLESLKSNVEKFKSTLEAVSELQDDIVTIKERMTNVHSNKDDSLVMAESMHKKTKATIVSLKKEKEKVDATLYGFTFWELGFGRQGIISLLIDEAIEELNEHTVEASIGLTDGLLSVIFDSTTMLKSTSGTSDKISMHCTVNGEASDYSNMSQSEQQRVDLCGMFGWQRMISSRVENVNLLFFDEVFDGMDADTTNTVYDYIRKLGINRPIYVVSHAEHLKKKADGIIHVHHTPKIGSQIQIEN